MINPDTDAEPLEDFLGGIVDRRAGAGGHGLAAQQLADVPAREPEESEEEELDYANMSDDDVEAEIQRLLEERQAQDKAKREAKIAAGEDVPVMPDADAPAQEEAKSEEPAPEEPVPAAPAPTPPPAPAAPARCRPP